MTNHKQFAAALLAGGSIVVLASAAHAQAAPDAAPQAVQEIVVTGSRVIANGNNSPTPVTVVTTDQIMELKPSTIADALNNLPQFMGSQSQASQPGNSSQNNAAAQLNLRNVGVTRTLILYDGHRVSPTSPTGAVDVDTIPQLLLQRVDVVTGGASAVYGSDAVSGVVNFISDTKFNGLKLNGQAGISNYGDDKTKDFAIAVGKSFMDGRLHFEASYQFHDDPGIFTKLGREWGRLNWTMQGAGTAANPYHLITHTGLAQSSFGGVIFSGPTVSGTCSALVIGCNYLEFNQNGVLTPFVHGVASGTNNIESGGDGAYYSAASLKSLLVSHQAFARVDYDFSDHMHGYVEFAGTLNHNENNHEWIEVRGNQGGTPGVLGFNNAFLQGVINPLTGTTLYNANSTATFNYGKMITQTGPYQPDTYQKNYMLLAGLQGDFRGYKWDIGVEHTNAVQDTRNNNNMNQAHLLAAENAVVNPANGQIVCHAALTNPNYANCVPINLFGPTSESAAALKYITGVTEYWAHTHMDDINGSITGAPFSTWAGPVNMALSAEWRKLTYNLVSNALPTDQVDCNGIQYNCSSSTTLWASNVLADRTPVSQSVSEVAIEADIPLVKDKPFFESFNLNGAFRYTNYSNSGGVNTWKIGADWKVNDQLTLRATRSRDIRAPNLNELYAPTLVNPAGVIDYLIGGGTSLNAPQKNGSNPNLLPEQADTTTAGLVYRPHFLPRFSLAVDAYRITVNGFISTVAGNNQTIQNICIASGGTSPYCALTVRPFPITNTTTANLLTATLSQPLNIASLDTYGADFEANYATSIGSHPLNLRALFTYQPHILLNNGPTGLVDNGDTQVPSNKLTVIGRYSVTDNFSISLLEKWRNSMRWTGVSTTPANGPIPAITKPVYSQPPIPSIQYTDLTLTYRLKSGAGNTDLFFNIQNLFNQQPVPYGNIGGSSSVPGLFGGYVQTAGDDPVGRYFTIGFKFRH